MKHVELYYAVRNWIGFIGIGLLLILLLVVVIYAGFNVIKEKLSRRKIDYLKSIGFERDIGQWVRNLKLGERISDNELESTSMRNLKKRFRKEIDNDKSIR